MAKQSSHTEVIAFGPILVLTSFSATNYKMFEYLCNGAFILERNYKSGKIQTNSHLQNTLRVGLKFFISKSIPVGIRSSHLNAAHKRF